MTPRPTFPERFNLADYFLFDRLREGLGEKAAVLFGERRYSYAAVAERADALTAALADRDVRQGERVLVVLRDSPAFVWAFFGALRRGSVVVMGNPETPTDDLAYLLDYTGATALVTHPAVASALGAHAGGVTRALRLCVVASDVSTGGDAEEAPAFHPLDGVPTLSLPAALAAGRARARAGLPAATPTHRDDPAIWLFTSGSTGRPKAAMHTHRDFAFNTEVYAKRTLGYQPGDVTVSVPRLYFGYATGTNLLFPFAVGATTALFSERPTPEHLCAAVARHRATIVTNVPTMMGKLLDHDDAAGATDAPRPDFASVRFHLSAGEALPPALLERFTARFGGEVYDGIGSAELFHIYCTNRPGDVRPGSLGRPVEGYLLRVLPAEAVDPGGPELPRGETGVLWVRGESVAMGYHRDREKSWATFAGAWCRTGDLFSMDAEGYLWFRGRADDLLKVSGLWVAPVEVEECLLEHPTVSAVAVIGREEAGLVKLKALVVLRESARAVLADAAGRASLEEELRAHVRTRLSRHKAPRVIEFVDELPRNDRGKVDRRVLLARERAEASASVA